jgi:hypothetical protein
VKRQYHPPPKSASPARSAAAIKAQQFPTPKCWLVFDFHDPTRINLEIPAPIHRYAQDVTHEHSNQSIVAHENKIFFPLVFFDKRLDAVEDILAAFPIFSVTLLAAFYTTPENLPLFQSEMVALLHADSPPDASDQTKQNNPLQSLLPLPLPVHRADTQSLNWLAVEWTLLALLQSEPLTIQAVTRNMPCSWVIFVLLRLPFLAEPRDQSTTI